MSKTQTRNKPGGSGLRPSQDATEHQSRGRTAAAVSNEKREREAAGPRLGAGSHRYWGPGAGSAETVRVISLSLWTAWFKATERDYVSKPQQTSKPNPKEDQSKP